VKEAFMRKITVAAPAKINLSLDVTGRRPDGYHLLSSVMQSIDLADRVTIELDPNSQGISLACSRGGLPVDRRNTAWRAAEYFMQAAGINLKTDIFIEKNIPASAGLAGGSTDAAGVLFALDMLFPDTIPRPGLFAIAARIGADVPFCLQGGTALCEGIGDMLTSLQPFAEIPLLLCKPRFGLSTVWAYQQLDLQKHGPDRRPDQIGVMEALARRDLPGLGRLTANVLESVSLPAYPLLKELKSKLTAAGADVVLMSGSGPSVYGLFDSIRLRDKACSELIDCLPGDSLVLPAITLASGPWLVYNKGH
jgi:4-diphosphocytidyl-2-C-methyl-D-erythritol kinase